MHKRGKLFLGGTVYTVDGKQPFAEAVAVRDGAIVTVGDQSVCKAALGRSYEQVDLGGGTLLPGFCDVHMHPLPTIVYTMKCNLLGVKDLGEIIDKLKASSHETTPGGWVIGLNFDEQSMTVPQIPTRLDLDLASREKPILVIKHDGHSIFTNSLALEKSGVTANTAEPEGGTIERDDREEPLGIFRESAISLILAHVSLPTLDELIAGARKAFGAMLGHGITSLGLILEADRNGRSGAFGEFEIPAIDLVRSHIKQSLYTFIVTNDVSIVETVRRSSIHSPHEARCVAGIKILADGTFGSCTAAMDEPFCDKPGTAGAMFYEEAELYDLMARAHNSGYQIAVHAIGDKTNRTCIALFDKLLKAYPRKNHRHRIEHASIMDKDMLRRVKENGLVLSVQPMFIHSDMPYLEKRIGKKRMEDTYPFRSIIEAGIPVAASSDSPVETQDVMAAIECAVTREGYVPSQAVTPAQAIRMYTLGAAYAQFEEHIKGSITPGKRADFVLLEENPLKVRHEEIHKIGVLKTFIAGELEYSSRP